LTNLAPASGAMESPGAYNRYAIVPAGGGDLATRYLEIAAQKAGFDWDERPVVIAHYGSSQGQNSLNPMRAAVNVMRSRLGSQRPIIFCHTDLPTNDFTCLFDLLESDTDSYGQNDHNVFPCAIGRSFYHSVLPSDYVDVGWCSYAAMWIEHNPDTRRDHIDVHRMAGPARSAFDRRGAQDWRKFLSLRAKELHSGGRLAAVMPSARDDGRSGI
jgi:hypothetical protein